MDENAIKEIKNLFVQLNDLLKQNLPPLKSRVDYVIKRKIDDYNQLDRLLNDLFDYTQIDEGLVVFKRLCRYCYSIYPALVVSYIESYREIYDPNTPCDDD